MTARILIALSSPEDLDQAREALERDGHRVATAPGDDAVWNELVEQRFDLVIAEVPRPALTLIGFLRRVEQAGHEAALLVLVPEGRSDLGWLAMNEGAYAFLERPLPTEPLRLLALRAMEHVRLRRECADSRVLLRERHAPSRWLDRPSLARLRAVVESRLNDTDPVLFCGERGTEAPDLARLVHYWGRHPDGPFLSLPALLQSRSSLEMGLFGTARRGHLRRPGWIEQAHGGTLFVEDLTQVPLETQTRLTRLLEDGQFLPPDASSPIRVQIRLLFSMHQIPEVAAANGTLDSTLYTLLRTQAVRIPPLRERSEDVPELACALLDAWGAGAVELAEEARNWLRASPWPGNRIQLEATLLRALLARRHEPEITRDDLQRGATGRADLPPRSAPVTGGAPVVPGDAEPGKSAMLRDEPGESAMPRDESGKSARPRDGASESAMPRDESGQSARAPRGSGESATRHDDELHLPLRGVDLVRLERRLIEEALERTLGNQTQAARLLGLTRQTLIYRMQKYGIR